MTGRAARTLTVRRLGRMEYGAAHELQKSLVEERRAGTVGDLLLLVEHPPVITLGARNRIAESHIVASEDDLRAAGVSVHQSGRGGDVTYHGPGQLVGYPILDLESGSPGRAPVRAGPRGGAYRRVGACWYRGPARARAERSVGG